MKSLRRNFVPGGCYFFTVVTHERRAFLTTDLARPILREAFDHQQKRWPFDILAIVLLPDHLHTLWQLPPDDSDYSLRWGLIKERFTRGFLRGGGSEGEVSSNRTRHRQRGIWQHRFWEHTVEDENDFKRCLDYIHWNPVKHKLATLPREYQWSTFEQWVARGEYDSNRGAKAVTDVPGADWD